MTIVRNYLYRNGVAYDIHRTIVNLLLLDQSEAIDDCVNRLIEMQYTPNDEDFLYDITAAPDGNGTFPLVYLDIWLASHGAQISLDDLLGDDDTLIEGDILTVDLPDGDDGELSFSDSEMSAVASLLSFRNPNLMVMRTFNSMYHNVPASIYVQDPDPTEEEIEEVEVDGN